MKKLNWKLILSGVVTLLLFVNIALAGQNNSPVGYWKQVSDHDGKVHSIVKVWNNNGKISGKIVAGFKVNGKLPKQYCTTCPGKFKGKQILGMTIIWGMHRQGNAWAGGHILDPDSGDIYKATMRLTKGGQNLIVRGYIGISIFGRSQTWLRIPSDQVKKELAKGLTKVVKR